MSTLDTLVIELVANTARLQQDVDKAAGVVKGAMDRIDGAVNLAKSAFIALGGAASVASLVNLVKGSIDTAEALHDLAIATGASVEGLSAMAEIGRYTGTSLEDIGGMMGKLAKNTAGVTAESAAASKALKAIGLDMETFRKLKPEEQMLTLATQMDKYADGAGKAQVAQALLGKGAEQYLPFLKDVAATGQLVATVTKEQADEADKFNDRAEELRATFDRTVRTLSLDLLPVFTKMLEGVGTAVKIFGAYMVLMVGLPAAVNAVSAAIAAKVSAMAAASAAAEMGMVANTGYIASMKAMVLQAGLLKVAFGTLFAAFAGWQIGKYLRENFLQAQLAGIAFVEGTLVGWEKVKYGAQAMWLAIKAAGAIAMDAIKSLFAGMVDAIGRGLRALGAEEAGRAMNEFAAKMRSGSDAGARLADDLAALKAQTDRNIDGIREITYAMADDAIAQFQVAKAVDAHKEAVVGLTEENKKAAKAQAESLDLIKITAGYELQLIEVTAKRIELTGKSAKELKAEADAAQAWQASIDSVFSGLTDALFRAFEEGKGFMQAFRDTLVNTFKNLVLQPTIKAIMGPIAGAMGGVMGGVGSAMGAVPGAAGGGGSGILGTLGSLGGLTGLGSMFGSGLGFGLIGGFGGGAGVLGTLGAGASMFSGGLAGGMAGIGSTLAGVGAMLGAVAPIAAAVYAIWKGFSRGPKKVTEQGITGTVVGGDATAELYEKWKQSGGWIVGDRKGVRYKDLGEEMSAGLDQATAGVYGQLAEWTKAIGLPAEKLAEVTHSISIKLGKDDAETQKNIEEAMDGYRLALAGKFSAALEPFRNAGETLVETLQRLVGIQAMSEQLNGFGGVFSRIANLSVSAREELIGFAGGIEALLGKVQSFVGAYYSEGEQAAIAARQIKDALGAMGIGADVSSRADFRALVEATDVATTEGRKQLDALLTLAQTFAPVADYLAKSGGTLAELADQAPQSELLKSIFDAGEAQAETAQRTADGIDRVNDSISAQTDATVTVLEALRAEVAALTVAVAAGLDDNARRITGAIEELPA